MSNDLERSEDLFGNFLSIKVFLDLLKGNLGILVRFLRRSRRILCLYGKLRDCKSVNLGGRAQTLYRTESPLSGRPCTAQIRLISG